MAMRETQIDSLASFLVHGLVARGVITPKADEADLVACVVELMSSNFETQAAIDTETDQMVEELVRKDTRLDADRLRSMIRQKIAEKKGFTL
ncbi:MAG TPA: DUF507 family protein [Candidatus Binataceae bacterium]|nr:DUF507 family protein [Candidatus Binataceae bacterium]